MEQPKIGSSLVYLSRGSKDGEIEVSEVTVIGYDPMPADSNALLPPAHVAFLHPERTTALTGADWRMAFDRISSVPHASDAEGKRHCYEVRTKAVEPGQEPAKEETSDEPEVAGSEPVDAFESGNAKAGKPYIGKDGKNYQVRKGGLIEVEPKAK